MHRAPSDLRFSFCCFVGSSNCHRFSICKNSGPRTRRNKICWWEHQIPMIKRYNQINDVACWRGLWGYLVRGFLDLLPSCHCLLAATVCLSVCLCPLSVCLSVCLSVWIVGFQRCSRDLQRNTRGIFFRQHAGQKNC